MSEKPCFEGREGFQALRMKGRSGAQHQSEDQTLFLRPRQVREFTQHGKVAALILNLVKRQNLAAFINASEGLFSLYSQQADRPS